MYTHYFALAFALLLLIYHQVTTVVSLFPWNDVEKYSRKELLLESLTNLVLMGTAAVCIICGNSGFFHYYPLIYYPFLLFGECVQWWLPYFSEKFSHSKVNFDYEKLFGRTTRLIPNKPGKRTPDANHIVLHLITIITTIFVYWDRLS